MRALEEKAALARRMAASARARKQSFSLLRFEVPVGVTNPACRIRTIKTISAKVRSEPALPFTEAVAGVRVRVGLVRAGGRRVLLRLAVERRLLR